jgi:hypothetical protein
VTERKTPPKDEQQERADRLDDAIRRGPRPARSPHEFVQEKMRDEQKRKGETPAGGGPRKSR